MILVLEFKALQREKKKKTTQNNSLWLERGGFLVIMAARMNLQQEQVTLLSLIFARL